MKSHNEFTFLIDFFFIVTLDIRSCLKLFFLSSKSVVSICFLWPAQFTNICLPVLVAILSFPKRTPPPTPHVSWLIWKCYRSYYNCRMVNYVFRLPGTPLAIKCLPAFKRQVLPYYIKSLVIWLSDFFWVVPDSCSKEKEKEKPNKFARTQTINIPCSSDS